MDELSKLKESLERQNSMKMIPSQHKKYYARLRKLTVERIDALESNPFNRLFGAWPGDESDEEIAAMLDNVK